ncbi:hypothetical protein [Flavobacterium sp.]|uniref:hypothetical protein n=1 Tax=Flavobacterium sp. TaxID=239 RepID=UPI0025FF45BD|nr:hypothetical protein [Flavobacterium sp.]
MSRFLAIPFFNFHEVKNRKLFFYAYFFPFFTVLALFIDSVFFTATYFDGRSLTNVLAITYFCLFFFSAQAYLRKLMFCMVFLSYLGELIFCKALGMYAYRTIDIPLYVPFGHAIVYASGFVFAGIPIIISNEKKLKKIFFVALAILFLMVGFFLNDVFSLIFGLLFFILMKRKKWQMVYFTIAFCVIFIELVGTYFRCWTWVPKTFGIIPAVNPPMGAVFFYAGGDVILAKIVSYWKSKTEISI